MSPPPYGPVSRNSSRVPWIKLQSNYWLDDALADAGQVAELIFIRSLCMAKFVDSNGELSRRHLDQIRAGIRGFDAGCEQLLAQNLWLPASNSNQSARPGAISIRNWHKYQLLTVDEPVSHNSSTSADGPTPSKSVKLSRNRVEKTRGEEEEGRAASQPDRPSSSAAAAPPRADAGAQPQQNQDQSQLRRGPGRRPFIEGDEDQRSWRDLAPAAESTGVSSTGQQRLAEMRAELAKRQETNPYSRRRPVQMVPKGWRATEPPIQAEVISTGEDDDPNPPEQLGYLMSRMLPPPPDFPEWEAVNE